MQRSNGWATARSVRDMSSRSIAGIIGAIFFVAVGWFILPGIVEVAINGVTNGNK